MKGEGDDFVESYLLHMEKEDTDKELFNEESLAINAMDLWFAGQETTTLTLYWAFAFLLLNENVMRRVEAELDEVTGKKRSLHLADKAQTPYFNAVILFNPERYFESNAKILEQHTVPFSMGRRQCLGEALARAEIYLILGNLLLWYDIRPDPENMPSMKAGREIGGFRRPAPYKMAIRRRKQWC